MNHPEELFIPLVAILSTFGIPGFVVWKYLEARNRERMLEIFDQFVLTLRANPLEDNLVLWQYVKGKRSSVKWVRNTPSPSGQWHELKLTVVGNKVQGWLNGVLTLSHDLEKPVSGRIGLWSKADSVVYFDDFRVEQIAR